MDFDSPIYVATEAGSWEYSASTRPPVLCRLGFHKWPVIRIPVPGTRLVLEWVACARCGDVVWGKGDSWRKLLRHVR
jgi:hypothetical protein